MWKNKFDYENQGFDWTRWAICKYCKYLQLVASLRLPVDSVRIPTTNVDKLKKILMLNILFKKTNLKECSKKTVGKMIYGLSSSFL